MRHLRSVVVLALLWVGSTAASSTPDGVGAPSGSSAGVVRAVSAQSEPVGGSFDRDPTGKRWAVRLRSGGRHSY